MVLGACSNEIDFLQHAIALEDDGAPPFPELLFVRCAHIPSLWPLRPPTAVALQADTIAAGPSPLRQCSLPPRHWPCLAPRPLDYSGESQADRWMAYESTMQDEDRAFIVGLSESEKQELQQMRRSSSFTRRTPRTSRVTSSREWRNTPAFCRSTDRMSASTER